MYTSEQWLGNFKYFPDYFFGNIALAYRRNKVFCSLQWSLTFLLAVCGTYHKLSRQPTHARRKPHNTWVERGVGMKTSSPWQKLPARVSWRVWWRNGISALRGSRHDSSFLTSQHDTSCRFEKGFAAKVSITQLVAAVASPFEEND